MVPSRRSTQSSTSTVMVQQPDTMRILVATDNHLGFAEKDPIRGNDSFDTFEEILQLAHVHQVDMLLLAGDLFHENKPSRRVMHRVIQLLRHYCLGSRPCYLELMSDPSLNFPSHFGRANFEDPNFNVSMPVFAIHGNHDDPSGEANLSALDILGMAGLVNYFGKSSQVDEITLHPVLMKKGSTGLALYGLGSIRDERLHRTFLNRRVRMLRPADSDTRTTGLRPEDWFNLLMIHQNRVAHSASGYIPETFLDDSLHLVIWGHEHDCRIEPERCSERDFYVCQPGSSVATSLSEGECKRAKSVALLEITGTEFQIKPLVLKTVRPFALGDVCLRNVPALDAADTKALSAYLVKQVESLIKEAIDEWIFRQGNERNDNVTDDSNPSPPLPLVRLKVDYSGDAFQSLNPHRFGQLFHDRVANPKEILLFYRKRLANNALQASSKRHLLASDISTITASGASSMIEVNRVEDLVHSLLQTGGHNLEVLPQNELLDSVKTFVEKDDRDVIEGFVKTSLSRVMSSLRLGSNQDKEKKNQIPLLIDESSIRHAIEQTRREREIEWDKLHPSSTSFSGPIIAIKKSRHNDSEDRKEEDKENQNEQDEEGGKQKKTIKTLDNQTIGKTATSFLRTATPESSDEDSMSQAPTAAPRNTVARRGRRRGASSAIPALQFEDTLTRDSHAASQVDASKWLAHKK